MTCSPHTSRHIYFENFFVVLFWCLKAWSLKTALCLSRRIFFLRCQIGADDDRCSSTVLCSEPGSCATYFLCFPCCVTTSVLQSQRDGVEYSQCIENFDSINNSALHRKRENRVWQLTVHTFAGEIIYSLPLETEYDERQSLAKLMGLSLFITHAKEICQMLLRCCLLFAFRTYVYLLQ